MAMSKAKELELVERRKKVASMYLRGFTQHEIAQAVGVDRGQISRDLEKLREDWLGSALMDFDERKAQELAKVDKLERTACKAWLRSCKPAETIRLETVRGRTRKGKEVTRHPNGAVVTRDIEIPLPDLVKTSKTSQGQAGDPRFLERIGWCVSERCKILALITNKHEHSGPGGGAIPHQHSPNEAIISAIRTNPAAADLACQLLEQLGPGQGDARGTGAPGHQGQVVPGQTPPAP